MPDAKVAITGISEFMQDKLRGAGAVLQSQESDWSECRLRGLRTGAVALGHIRCGKTFYHIAPVVAFRNGESDE
jgi:hypothetical protein